MDRPIKFFIKLKDNWVSGPGYLVVEEPNYILIATRDFNDFPPKDLGYSKDFLIFIKENHNIYTRYIRGFMYRVWKDCLAYKSYSSLIACRELTGNEKAKWNGIINEFTELHRT